MTTQEQIQTINTRDWYTAMRTQAGKIISAMQANQFSIPGDSWVETTVTGVQTRFQLRDINVLLEAGKNDDDEPIYVWMFPIGWVTP